MESWISRASLVRSSMTASSRWACAACWRSVMSRTMAMMHRRPANSAVEADISAGTDLPVLVRQLSSLVQPWPSRITDRAKVCRAGISVG